MNGTFTKYQLVTLLFVTISCFIVLMFLPPIAQDIHYHCFADARSLLGIPNFWNVVSNIPFLVVGILGLWNGVYASNSLRFFFFGILLTGLGSAWYHWDPDNASLLWDRLPMTIAFMSLLSWVIFQHADTRLADALLWPLLLVGLGSVLYWYYTEQIGEGDLRAYVFVQFYPMLLIPMIMLMRPVSGSVRFILLPMLGMYALAKYFEFADRDVYAFGEILSGHTLKHLCAAAAVIPLLAWRKVYGSQAILNLQRVIN